ncbi:hypothetical protein FEM48_Zijuj10G0152500 [Ziziphus jujuba var. spinosa]|uniref:Piriformospora indica-insensitive protein 2-like n=1 Tax=Ziziphus jujuba var. spinosa TaxID=714518 RepID=A0A978UP50_ZIZJJ|nr:hypothetical protein FEM48_Zijuj10G0152500 [Ziziphus jujuba var. spinosa]
MKFLTSINLLVFVVFIIFLFGWCYGEEDIDVAPMEKTEKEALYSAIQGFVGNGWNGSDLYPDPCGWTPIQGVCCDLFDGLWYVTGLNIGPIHENSLGCTRKTEFRPQLFELKHLKTLSFFSCFISPYKHPVSIPTVNWENFAGSLESLEFRSNPGLIGQIPAIFGSLVKLQSLVFLENGLTGRLPSEIGNLVNLKRLVLSGNKFTGRIPNTFGALNQLLIFDLSRNSLSGPLPLTLGSLTSLLKLDLSNNLLEGKLLSEIGSLENLTLLDLRNNNFSGGLPQSFQQLHSLEEMALYNNPIGGDLMGLDWQKLQKLAILDLSNTGLAGEIPESMTELNGLRFLGLSNNKISSNLPPKLANLPCLSAMYLNGNNLTGELKFSAWFYGKMGRRFGVWNNPNLCYPIGLMPASKAPFGVKPCQPKLKLLQQNSETQLGDSNLNQKSKFVASLGSSINSIDGFWWVYPLELLMMFKLLNLFL